MTTPDPDTALLEAIANERDEDAFAAFYLRHAQPARTLALRMMGNPAQADDILQESMLQVWRRAGTFRPGNARGWLSQIVTRECIRLRNRAHSRQPALMPACNAAPGDEMERQQLLASLQRFMAELPVAERSLVRLRFNDGLSQRQISSVLRIPQQTVSRRLKLAIERLRRRFVLQLARN